MSILAVKYDFSAVVYKKSSVRHTLDNYNKTSRNSSKCLSNYNIYRLDSFKNIYKESPVLHTIGKIYQE